MAFHSPDDTPTKEEAVMIQRIYRIVFLLFVTAGAVRLSAQARSSEVAVWVVDTRWSDSRVDADNSGLFDEKTGTGIAFNRYWTERFSTELSAQRLSSNAILGANAIPIAAFCGFGELGQPDVIVLHPFNTGKLEVMSITAMAQMHFNRAGRVAPYLGAGVAHMSGDFESADPAVMSFDLESEMALAAAAGLDVRITDRVFLTGELKYIPWSAVAEGNSGGESFDIDPLTLAAGVKFRF
jgi:outer membrane protein W